MRTIFSSRTRKTCAMTVTLLMLASAMICLAPGIGATDLTTLSDGSSEATVEITMGGEDTSLSLKLPKQATVNTATMDITGLGISFPFPVPWDFDFNDTDNNEAFYGGNDNQASGLPSGYEANDFTAGDYTNVADSDDDRMTTTGIQGQYAYHHFAFFVPMSDITSIVAVWEGGALSNPQGPGFGSGGAKVFIYNNQTSSWDDVGDFTCGEIWCEQWVTNTFTTNPGNYLDGDLMVHLLATSIQGPNFNSYIDTDFVKLNVTGKPTSFPLDPTLDVGNDGDDEWTFSGMLFTTDTVSGQVLVDELNAHVAAAGDGPGDVTITLSLSSVTPGKLKISNILIDYTEFVDHPPELVEQIPSDKTIDEDTDGPDLIDLNDHFSDVEDADLVFTIVNKSEPEGLDATIDADGKMDFVTPTENWFGEATFKVRAEDDLGQTVDSNEFTVTVVSVNDAPVLDPINALTAKEGQPFVHRSEASDVDTALDASEYVRFSNNGTLFTINPVTGDINFTPTDADVGIHVINFSVKDRLGLEDHEHVQLTIDDVNNRPVLTSIGNRTLKEDVPFTLQLEVTDLDSKDSHTFSSRGDLFVISEDGLINFTPVQDDVGDHTMVLGVSDGELEAFETMVFTVLNVNDAPTIEAVPDQTADNRKEFRYTVLASDEDLGYDDDEVLTYSDDTTLFDINGTTGEIAFTPTPDQAGPHKVTITVRDNLGLEATVTMDLEIVLVNSAPVVEIRTTKDKTSFKKGSTVTLTAVATDADGDDLTYSWRLEGETSELGTNDTLDLKAKRTGKFTYIVVVSDGITETEANVTIKIRKDEAGTPGFNAGLLLGALVGVAIAVTLRGPRVK